eukprot:TRINITY_DN2796_c1_g1_i1.p1 TRINITY_DN2796_c1_g1~~TRINITY_DN2796_c1_g1_i1.p1  ORF type:complete len:853 (+),score=179.24 TRINITY_DN2796_c1_g1_i1:66-2561(+)
MLSIRISMTGLLGLCVFATAFVCLYMTIVSSDEALSDVKDVRDTSLDRCFNTSSAMLLEKGSALMSSLSDNAVLRVTNYFAQFEEVVRTNVAAAEAPRDGYPMTTQPELFEKLWMLRSLLLFGVDRYKYEGLRGAGYYTMNREVKVSSLSTNYTELALLGNNGANLSVTHSIRTTVQTVGMAPHFNYNDPAPMCNPMATSASSTPCLTTGLVPSETAFLMSKIGAGSENVRWGRIYAGPGYILSVVLGVWRDDFGVKVGTAHAALNLDSISNFLSGIGMGTTKGRIFTVIRGDWMGFGSTQQLGWMTGVSHGRATWGPHETTDPNFVQYSGREAIHAPDNLIQGTASFLHRLDNSTKVAGYESVFKNGAVELHLNTSNGEESFYLQVSLLAPGPGFDWFLVVLLDREFVMGEVDRVLVAIKEDIDTNSERIDDDLKTSRSTMFITVSAVMVVLAAAGIGLVYYITFPLLVLQTEMGLVACMNLDAVNENRPKSALDEVNKMQESFIQMINNIKEYRSYMPASVLVTYSEECDETDDLTLPDSEVKKSGSSSRSQSGSELASSIQQHRKEAANTALKLQLGDMKTKDVVILVANRRGTLDDPDFHFYQEEYLETILSISLVHKGIPESFYGDNIFLTWNAVKPVSQASVHVASCALAIRQGVEDTSIGMAGDRVKVGNMGCSSMRRFSFMGYLFPLTLLVEKLNKVYESRTLSAGLGDAIKQTFFTKLVDRVVISKCCLKPIDLLEIMQPKQVGDEEWMYQLERGNADDPYKMYSDAVEKFFQGDVVEAVEMFGPVAESHAHDKQVNTIHSRMLKSVECGFKSVESLPFACF